MAEIRRNGTERGRLRAAELFGKHYGMFEKRPPAEHLHLHAEMSEKEREALAERAARRGRRFEEEPPVEG